MDKANLRRQAREARASLSVPHAAAVARFLRSPLWLESRVVALYLALPGEPELDPLIRDGWSRGVTVLLPRVVQPSTPLAWVAYRPDAALLPGPRRTRHPDGSDWARLDEVALVVVPGFCANSNGFRLGYGGGYYDRSLPMLQNAVRVWIGADDQVREDVPVDPWDLPVHALATPAGLRFVANADTPGSQPGPS